MPGRPCVDGFDAWRRPPTTSRPTGSRTPTGCSPSATPAPTRPAPAVPAAGPTSRTSCSPTRSSGPSTGSGTSSPRHPDPQPAVLAGAVVAHLQRRVPPGADLVAPGGVQGDGVRRAPRGRDGGAPEARALVERRGWRIGFPVEIRQAPPEDAWLGTAHGRDTVHLSFHVNARTDHRAYFAGVEEVMRAHDGRPHWGKLHTRAAADLAPAYPRFADFVALRDRVDPDGLFTNGYLDRVLGRRDDSPGEPGPGQSRSGTTRARHAWSGAAPRSRSCSGGVVVARTRAACGCWRPATRRRTTCRRLLPRTARCGPRRAARSASGRARRRTSTSSAATTVAPSGPGGTTPPPPAAYAALRRPRGALPGAMDRCTVDGEVVRPQPGGFYGGWVTSRVVGPFKGDPGTMFW